MISDTKKWWECKNVFGRVGYVPNTIVTVVDPSSVDKAHHNGGVRSYDQPLFIRPGGGGNAGGSNSGPPSATYLPQVNAEFSSTLSDYMRAFCRKEAAHISVVVRLVRTPIHTLPEAPIRPST